MLAEQADLPHNDAKTYNCHAGVEQFTNTALQICPYLQCSQSTLLPPGRLV